MELQEKLLKDDKRFLSEIFDNNAWDSDVLRANTVK